jgi:tRNA dimethylallyltransferase
MTSFKQLALIGPTASGKTALAIKLAHKNAANILSLDSLALYKEINIASAKPTLKERENIRHFGIDELCPNEVFDVTTFIKLYKKAKIESIKEEKNLIIVGGTSFYLSSLIKGISDLPTISKEAQEKSNKLLSNVKVAHSFLNNLDPEHMSNIKSSDTYRIEKMLNLYFETSLIPTAYFDANPPKAIITDKLPIYEIEVDRDILRERIKKRTVQMLKSGLIDEVFYLEKKYTRQANCMKSIGIKEVLSYLDGHYSKIEMKERIFIHTSQLAKRQRTFNRSQFQNKTLFPLETLTSLLLNF